MPGLTSRRRVLRAGCAAATGMVLGIGRRMSAAQRASVAATNVISQQPGVYHGWPTIARRRNGELLLVYSGGRESHVCPFGRLELMRSRDEGRTWSFPRVLIDGPVDDRDAGVLETAKGSILVSTFTSVGYEERLAAAEKMKLGDANSWSEEKLQRWRAVHRRLDPAQREIELGSWMIRSTDAGQSWSARYRCLVDSPHGPIQLSDGRVLYAGKMFWYGRGGQDAGRIGACESTDDGQTWRWLAEIPSRPGDTHHNYHELHAVETDDGTIVAQIRNHNKANEKQTLQSESRDGGRTWSTPRSIGVWGFPSHLLKLRDGRLVMTYGHRARPLGNLARVSEDQGRTWSEAMTISDDGTSSDIGYPSTVQLTDGSLLTVWYELMGSWPGDLDHYNTKGRDEAWFKRTEKLPRAALRQARWSIEG